MGEIAQKIYYMRLKQCRAKSAFVSNAGFSSAQEGFGGARVGWVFIRSGFPDSKKVPLLFNRQFGRDWEVVGGVFCAFRARSPDV